MDEGVKVILFDLGNVLVDFDYSPAVQRIARFSDKKPQEILGLIFDSGLTGSFEEGNISPKDFFQKLKKLLGLRLSYEAFVPIWNEVFFLSPKNRLVYSLANNLRLSYQVALLSNVNLLHYEHLKKHFPVFNVFHRVFVSCEMGIIKPKREIYQKTLDELGILPQEVFYTDDRADLIKSAQELGIKAFVFSGVNQLKDDLRSVGVTLS